jgi:hypothetical protein
MLLASATVVAKRAAAPIRTAAYRPSPPTKRTVRYRLWAPA